MTSYRNHRCQRDVYDVTTINIFIWLIYWFWVSGVLLLIGLVDLGDYFWCVCVLYFGGRVYVFCFYFHICNYKPICFYMVTVIVFVGYRLY